MGREESPARTKALLQGNQFSQRSAIADDIIGLGARRAQRQAQLRNRNTRVGDRKFATCGLKHRADTILLDLRDTSAGRLGWLLLLADERSGFRCCELLDRQRYKAGTGSQSDGVRPKLGRQLI